MSASRTWDALVVGAGPAGAVAAGQLALAGRSVLLVERQVLPRDKPCGGCLGAAGVATLQHLHLSAALHAARAVPLTRVALLARAGRVELSWPGGAILERRAFDHALVEHAVAAGATLRDGTRATLRPADDGEPAHVALSLAGGGETLERARLVVAADGLSGGLLAGHPRLGACRVRRARVGAAAHLPEPIAEALRQRAGLHEGELLMVLGTTGYVGLAAGAGTLQVAAALDAPAVARAGGAGPAARAVLESAGLAVPRAFEDAPWKGTPPLARARTTVAVPGLLVVGDAAGYGEPLTGDGMACALQGAATLARLVALHEDGAALAAAWERGHRRLAGARRRTSLALGAWLTRAAAQRLLVGLARRRPAWIERAARHVASGGPGA